jgi:hypothetical protein
MEGVPEINRTGREEALRGAIHPDDLDILLKTASLG